VQSLQGLWVNSWYADDGTLIGPVPYVERALEVLQRDLVPLGLSLNMRKCVTWGPGTPLPLLKQTTVCPFTQGSGVVVLGSPVSFPDPEAAYLKAYWAAKLSEMRLLVDRIGTLGHSQMEHALLRASADAARVTHLLRSTNTRACLPALQSIHDLLSQGVESLLGKALTPDQLFQAFLPCKMGGLGIKSPLHQVLPGRLSAIVSYLKDREDGHCPVPDQVRQTVPPDFVAILTDARAELGASVEPLSSWVANPLTAATASHRDSTQQKWADQLWQRQFRTWKTTGSHRELCRKALQTPNTASWLSCSPNANDNTLFEHCDYKVALQWWMGVPIAPETEVGATCPLCGACQDAWGDHAVTCRNNGITQRHSSVQQWLLTTARQAGVPCVQEAMLPDGRRPGDVLLQRWAGQGPRAVDLTVVHPLRPSSARPTVERVRESLLREEKAKEDKYRDACHAHHWAFQPLVFHPWAGTTPQGAVFLHRLCRLHAENAEHPPLKPDRVRMFWQTLTCTIMGEVARQLRSTSYTGPTDPLLSDSPAVDAAGNDHAARGKRPRRAPGGTASSPASAASSPRSHQPYAS
jgi:hypothetical protein